MDDFKQQALTEHLAELRHCLIVSLIAVAVGFGVCYNYAKEISVWFLRPLMQVLPAGDTLIFTSYQEAFFFI
jgi:Sec-independent protein secretion pathway component TatC